MENYIQKKQNEYIIEILKQDKPWDWYGISRNPNITWDIIKENPEKPWNWCYLSRHPNITFDIIKEYPEKPWDWFGLSCNPNITWDIIQENLDRLWSWSELSSNPNITWDIIQENLDKPWNWIAISCNPNILKLPDDFKIKYINEYIAINKIKRAWRLCNSDPNFSICRKRLLEEYGELH